MNKDEIMQILPHRDPMLLIEEAESDGETATAKYTVRGDEFFLQGHFPGNPVVPGVILCEMMGQSACVLVAKEGEKFTPYFTGMNNVKFRNKVLVGDTITFKTTVDKVRGAFHFIKSAGYVNDKLCVSGELSFAIVKD